MFDLEEELVESLQEGEVVMYIRKCKNPDSLHKIAVKHLETIQAVKALAKNKFTALDTLDFLLYSGEINTDKSYNKHSLKVQAIFENCANPIPEDMINRLLHRCIVTKQHRTSIYLTPMAMATIAVRIKSFANQDVILKGLRSNIKGIRCILVNPYLDASFFSQINELRLNLLAKVLLINHPNCPVELLKKYSKSSSYILKNTAVLQLTKRGL
jgi:hypothetical protein